MFCCSRSQWIFSLVAPCFFTTQFPHVSHMNLLQLFAAWTHGVWSLGHVLHVRPFRRYCVSITSSACLHKFDRSLSFSHSLCLFLVVRRSSYNCLHCSFWCDSVWGVYMFDTFSARREKMLHVVWCVSHNWWLTTPVFVYPN